MGGRQRVEAATGKQLEAVREQEVTTDEPAVKRRMTLWGLGSLT